MYELDPRAKQQLLGDLQQLHVLLHADSDTSSWPGATTATTSAEPSPSQQSAQLDENAVEPPLLEDFVDPEPADFDPAAFEDTDWNEFVDQVFAQTRGTTAIGVATSTLATSQAASTADTAGDEDALLAELTRRLDARLAALRATMLAELESLLARRRRSG